jgi:uncharacterized membrane protein
MNGEKKVKNMNKKIVFIGVVVIVVMIYLGGCTGTTQNKNNGNTNTNTPAPQQNSIEVIIPLSEISTTATFYSYDSGGVTIRYFAVNDKQGNVHVAFDACDVCYEAKKGYKQNGDVMQCLNCGKTFSITSIGTENTAGGCWPSYLPMQLNGTNIIIKRADLEAKSFMF